MRCRCRRPIFPVMWVANRSTSHPRRAAEHAGSRFWAVIASLGRDGVEELVERNCRHARCFAEGLRGAGYEILY